MSLYLLVRASAYLTNRERGNLKSEEILTQSSFPSSQRRGGRGINQKSRSHRSAVAGVARSASAIARSLKRGRSLNTRSASPIGRSLKRSLAKMFRPEDFAELTTPAAPN